MATQGKKYKAAKEEIPYSSMPHRDALNTIKNASFAQFNESIDVDVNLGIDPTKGEQIVRGSVVLPHTVGPAPRVIAFAKGDYAQQAKKAGADVVGDQDLVEKIEGGWLDFDAAVATPDMMGLVSKLAKTLGPKGLLPNKKLGTVTFDIETIVTDLKRGRKFFKNDKSGLVHFPVGKVSFDVSQLADNLKAFLKALLMAKPPTAKGKYIQKITITSTMGPGIQVDVDEILS